MGNLFKSKREFIAAFKEKYEELEGREFPEKADVAISYVTLLSLFREKINVSWIDTGKKYAKYNERQIYYFSMEFLIGRLLKYYLMNLDIQDIVEAGLEEMDINYEEVLEQEADPGTGNGGLGRLAACLLDSMAHMGMAGHGNGMRYRFGLFNQKIINGYQMELPDNWLKNGYPWERCKREKAVIVKFNGDIVYSEENGSPKFTLENYQPVLAVPYDIPMIGMKDTLNINNLRLWSAEPVEEEMDMKSFNTGNFGKAMQYQSEVEAISYILYPDDRYPSGRELRLKQEYLIVSAGIQSIIRYQKKNGLRIQNLSRKVGLHINDTHPALCVPELMRILLDEENLSWDQAWTITNNTISYTNHTILPEALEKWPVGLVRSLLPRVYQIIEEIDRRYMEEINLKFDGKAKGLLDKTAIVRDGYVHMACLAIIGSYSVNGVAKLHSKILKENIFPEFNQIYPGKFTNITNGVSHRRFLFSANPTLSDLITSKIGDEWREKAADLISLKNFENDKEFLGQINQAKLENKKALAKYIEKSNGVIVNLDSIFDIQAKRIHAYKRQLLSALKIMDLYNRIKDNPNLDVPACTFIFAGKSAPGYIYAKATIKLINMLAEKINNDTEINDKIKVIFLENFNVTLAEMIYPAAEISEQISTASQEASGTGNMKFMFNGAVTLGTLDGANVEILEAAGPENISIFGITAEEVMELQKNSNYLTKEEWETNPRLKKVLNQLIDGSYGSDTGESKMIYDSLVNNNDTFFVLNDFQSYMDAFDDLC
ncbi:MAG: glycogen/starch/alpha-glucan phosphorylase, partial [Peptostreptococcaceae bacterium]|nr:glycogen/starch/alpha-glucan phosphorylase [Peptostreptococcaceae bacterium]